VGDEFLVPKGGGGVVCIIAHQICSQLRKKKGIKPTPLLRKKKRKKERESWTCVSFLLFLFPTRKEGEKNTNSNLFSGREKRGGGGKKKRGILILILYCSSL